LLLPVLMQLLLPPLILLLLRLGSLLPLTPAPAACLAAAALLTPCTAAAYPSLLAAPSFITALTPAIL
jgi:hypothetical protein